ncbi:MAG: cytochrome b [Parvularculaceae bacterium]|nr:cytochrome b [Parvularculaceae bacterium]
MAQQDRYTAVAIGLHWLIALLIVGQIAGGFIMADLPDGSPLKFQAFQLHKSFGLTVLILTVVRLGWRIGHKPPPLPAAMPGWEKAAARATHVGFYALLIALPLLGWAFVSATPFQVPTFLFGVIPWPHLPFFEGVADRKAVAEQIMGLHEAAAFVMIGLAALHVLAALKHHFVNRDPVLARMLPFLRRDA